jgi:hypothetical protein
MALEAEIGMRAIDPLELRGVSGIERWQNGIGF